MKSKLKSASITWILGSFFSLLLVACSDESFKTPNIFSGIEVPNEVLAEPRIVAQPSAADLNKTTYPRLGDVPTKPTDFSPPAVINQERDQMIADRKAGEEARKDLENQPLPPPPPIQP